MPTLDLVAGLQVGVIIALSIWGLTITARVWARGIRRMLEAGADE